jgi:hypothetical protein
MGRIATLLAHGRLTTRLRLFTDAHEVRVLERLVSRVVPALLSVGVGLDSVLLLRTEGAPEFAAICVDLYEVLGWIGLALAMILLTRVLLAVLRVDESAA